GSTSDHIPFERWHVLYLSKDPIGTRRDFGFKLQDGGDAECSMRIRAVKPRAPCTSAPVLCFSPDTTGGHFSPDTTARICVTFKYARDSLALQSGGSYVRARSGGGGAETSVSAR